ncbi:nuclear transport factor 2 family protein [Pseudomonas oryzihabitans]|uniref:nuclear transport factor 2 family protein n=1 Tax=Pseudomonas oryzihabitans TaxID=47885 RepID=UPI0028959731|nr:nuclear transport factor 2 family protein [Pseudomonas oryzihabitans]MDT3720091.1 nuclear transport factor 2 family protein [Pseudomonas oryzihabitans]
MTSNRDLIRRTYEGSPEDRTRHLLAALSPDVEWTEAEGFPYAGTYVGIEALMQGVFQRLATEWDGFQAQAHTYLADGDRVAAFGVYSGTFKATGKSMTAHFAHLYQLRDGRIVRMQQYVDSALVQQALA